MHLNKHIHLKNNIFYGLCLIVMHDQSSQGLKNLISSQQLDG